MCEMTEKVSCGSYSCALFCTAMVSSGSRSRPNSMSVSRKTDLDTVSGCSWWATSR